MPSAAMHTATTDAKRKLGLIVDRRIFTLGRSRSRDTTTFYCRRFAGARVRQEIAGGGSRYPCVRPGKEENYGSANTTTAMLSCMLPELGFVQRLDRAPHIGAVSRRNRDVLLAVDCVGDDAAVHAGADVEPPQQVAGLGVQRFDEAVAGAEEQQAATGGQQGRVRDEVIALFPGELPGDRVTRGQAAMALVAGRVGADPFGAHERLHERLQNPVFGAGGDRGPAALRLHGQVHAPFLRDAIEQLGLRAVGSRFPAVPTVDRRAHQGLLAGHGPQHVLPLALVDVVPGGPVVALHVGIDRQDLAALGLVHVVEAVLARMQHLVSENDVLAGSGVVVVRIGQALPGSTSSACRCSDPAQPSTTCRACHPSASASAFVSRQLVPQ